jgi:type IV secretory pathway component VirB8
MSSTITTIIRYALDITEQKKNGNIKKWVIFVSLRFHKQITENSF